MKILRNIIYLLALVYSTGSFSQVQMPSFFSDNMVLQQDTLVAIWGTDKANVKVEVSTSWGEKIATKTYLKNRNSFDEYSPMTALSSSTSGYEVAINFARSD